MASLKKGVFCSCFLFASLLMGGESVVWSEGFDQRPEGSVYGPVALGGQTRLSYWNKAGQASLFVTQAESGGRWLAVTLPRGAFGPSNVIAAAELPEAKAYRMRYQVRFARDFEFGQGNSNDPRSHGGGKLPGLAGGSRPSGGEGKPDGMSARLMWRRDARFGKLMNYLELYLYWPDQREKYGDRFFLAEVVPGNTHQIDLRVALGSDVSDGRIQVSIDGRNCLDQGFRFLRSGHPWALDQLLFNVFYGGNDESWAPLGDTQLWLDQIEVSRPN